jgi:hypothetical protein
MIERESIEAALERPAGGKPAPVDRRELVEMGMLLLALLATDFLLPRVLYGDGLARYQALDQLLRGGGIPDTKYSLIMPLFAAPLWFLGALSGDTAQTKIQTQRFNPLLMGISIIIFYLLLRRRIDGRVLRTFLLLLLLASMFPYSLTQFYGEPFTALYVALGLLIAGLSAPLPKRLAGWALVALGVANTPATLLGLAVMVVQRIWVSKRWRYVLAILAAGALIVGESLVRRGGLFTSGYEQDSGGGPTAPVVGGWLPGFNYPFLPGLLALLFSFGKGLVFYAPGLFLPLRSRLKALGEQGTALWRVHLSWMGFTLGLLLIYAAWWDWSGDWFWGPRFLLFASIPASLALAFWSQKPSTRLWVNLLALGALALSFWAGISGAVFGLANMDVCDVPDVNLQSLCRFDPLYSALWRPVVNFVTYGPTAQFWAVEKLTPWGMAYAVISLAIGAYLATPLLSAIARQTRALLAKRAPAVRERLASLRF